MFTKILFGFSCLFGTHYLQQTSETSY